MMKKSLLKKLNNSPKLVEKHLKKITEKGTAFQEEVKKNAAMAIIAGFSFIIGLVWRDAIQLGMDKILVHLKISDSFLISKIVTALIVTAIGVFAITQINKWIKKTSLR